MPPPSTWGKKAENYYGGSDVEDLSDSEDRKDLELEAEQIARKHKERIGKTNKALGGDNDFMSDYDDDSDEEGSDSDDDDEKEEDSDSKTKTTKSSKDKIQKSDSSKKSSSKESDPDKVKQDTQTIDINLNSNINANTNSDEFKLEASLTHDQKQILQRQRVPELEPLLNDYVSESAFLKKLSQMNTSAVLSDSSVSDYITQRKIFGQRYLSYLSFYLHLRQQETMEFRQNSNSKQDTNDSESDQSLLTPKATLLKHHPIFDTIASLREKREKIFGKNDKILIEEIENNLSLNGNETEFSPKDSDKNDDLEADSDIDMNEWEIESEEGSENEEELEGDEEEEDSDDDATSDICMEDLMQEEMAMRKTSSSKSNSKKTVSKSESTKVNTKSSHKATTVTKESKDQTQNLTPREKMLQKLQALKQKQEAKLADRNVLHSSMGGKSRKDLKNEIARKVPVPTVSSKRTLKESQKLDYDPSLGSLQDTTTSAVFHNMKSKSEKMKELNNLMNSGQRIDDKYNINNANSNKAVEANVEMKRRERVQRIEDDEEIVDMFGGGDFDSPTPSKSDLLKEQRRLQNEKDQERSRLKTLAKRQDLKTGKLDKSKLSQAQKNHLEIQDQDAHRNASKKILQNRGLVRMRGKNNSRVKGRKKWEKQQKRLVGAGHKKNIEAGDSYGGEMSGIRTNVVKSHKIR